VSFDLGARMTQFFVGGRIASTAEQVEARRQLHEASSFAPDDPVSLVIVDVIWLDGESLLEVPLLERKRQLESIIKASDLVRLGAYVRPPIDTWIGSWRAVGFRDLSFRGANSRYRPGAVGEDWTTVPIPRR
jgi:ATP-dependent DNA ligase